MFINFREIGRGEREEGVERERVKEKHQHERNIYQLSPIHVLTRDQPKYVP